MIRYFSYLLLLVLIVPLQSCDKCRNLDCQNGGECVDGRCECPDGYQGETCQQQERDKFIADFEGQEMCLYTNNPPLVSIASGTEVTEITITGLYRYTTAVRAIVDDATFIIPHQDFGASTIHGSGSLSSTTLTINYAITGNGNYDECEVVAEKIF